VITILVDHNIKAGCDMEKHKTITLDTVLGLAKQLSAVERLKLVEHVLVELEPFVAGKEAKKRKALRGTLEGYSLTEDEIEEVERKLWGKTGVEQPKRVVQFEGLWEDIPLDISTEDIRQVRQELSEALKRRAERL
jgi:hypothetical protein